jgi:hypothetical protein
MMPWNNPKKKAIRKKGQNVARLKMMPHAMDTARQSMANPKAIVMMSNRFIQGSGF